MPPATPTFRLSISPGMGMATGRHARSAVSDRPCPSLPSTKHTPSRSAETAASAPTASDAVGSAQYRTRPREVVRVSSSSHESRARGRRNTPPRAARSACEFSGKSVSREREPEGHDAARFPPTHVGVTRNDAWVTRFETYLIVERVARSRKQRDGVPPERERRARQRAQVPRILDAVQREDASRRGRDTPEGLDAVQRGCRELGDDVHPVHGLQSRGFLEHVLGRAHDPSRAHTARGLSILAQENHPRVLDAAVGVYLLQHTRARDHHRPARVPVRLALDELGEVLHRGVVGAGHALLVARVSRGDSHAARTAAAAPGRSADADAPRDAGERRRARGRGRYRAHGATPRHHAVGHGLRASSSLPPTRGRRRRRCGDLSKKKTSPSSARHRHRRPGFFSGGASSAFPQSSMGHPRASACFLRRGSGLTTTGCPTFSSSSTSDIESE